MKRSRDGMFKIMALCISILMCMVSPLTALAADGSGSELATAVTQESGRPENYGSLVDQGSCGSGVTWEVYDSGLLIIDGKGGMDFRGSFYSPWAEEHGESIRGIIVGENVEYICRNAFRGVNNCQILMFKGSWSRDRFHNDAMDGFDINHHSLILRTPGDASWKQYKPWIPSMFDINWTTMRDIGICGESAFWVQNEDGMLEICGTGEVSENIFTEDGSRVTSVIVREGITGFGDVSFPISRIKTSSHSPSPIRCAFSPTACLTTTTPSSVLPFHRV